MLLREETRAMSWLVSIRYLGAHFSLHKYNYIPDCEVFFPEATDISQTQAPNTF